MAKFDEDPAKIARCGAPAEVVCEHQRNLPWRQSSNPYAYWVSEIMLQQTRVAVVADRYQEFMGGFRRWSRWPWSRTGCAGAVEWAGLLSAGAHAAQGSKFVASHLGGIYLRGRRVARSAGIGAYTAAACGEHCTRRASSRGGWQRGARALRLAGWDAGSRKGGGATLRHKIEDLAGRLLDRAQPGDFNQAIMELGATVCAPRNPQCAVCPLMADCKTRGEHKTPRRAPMMSRAVGYALSVRTESEAGRQRGPGGREVLLEQRSAQQNGDAGHVGTAGTYPC